MTIPCLTEAYRFARRRGLGHEDAEDVAQDVLLKLWQRGHPTSDSGLTACIARRTLASFLRRELARKRDRRRQVPLIHADNIEAVAEEGWNPAEARHRTLSEVRRGRTPWSFQVFQLRLEGSSYREIGRCVGRPVQDVANCLHRVKKGLRNRFAYS